MNVEQNVREYLYGAGSGEDRNPLDRYASFDYCFNYFQSFRECGNIAALADAEHLQTSCLHLGFYLASWGMFRGKAFLLQKSVKIYEPLIQAIVAAGPDLWEIDADNYGAASIKRLMECTNLFSEALGHAGSPILTTKILLGVFGSVPAFDRYFTTGFKKSCGVGSFGPLALENIKAFYEAHKALIEQYRVLTLSLPWIFLQDNRRKDSTPGQRLLTWYSS